MHYPLPVKDRRMSESFPERVARIKEEQNVTTMTARSIAAAESRVEREIRDKRTRALADAMRESAK
jgi:hypothetical protein